MGRGDIRHIPADDEFRMRPDELEAAILADRANGMRPFCVVPTLGTTSSSSLDPLPEIAAIARRYQLWLHVDAAYAGPAAVLDEYRHILQGAELADSIVVNPHKWLFTPVDLSALYTRRPEVFRSALSLEETPAYLPASNNAAEVNLSDYSVALGRRFRALKLWFVLRYYGREGIAEILHGHMRMARDFAALCTRTLASNWPRRCCFHWSAGPFARVNRRNRGLLERSIRLASALLSGIPAWKIRPAAGHRQHRDDRRGCSGNLEADIGQVS